MTDLAPGLDEVGHDVDEALLADEAPVSTIDLSLVSTITSEVAAELSDLPALVDPDTGEIDMPAETARAEPLIWAAIDRAVEERLRNRSDTLSIDDEEAIFKRARADLFGLSGFEEYLFDPSVENVFVNGADRVFVNRSGASEPERVAPIVQTDHALIELVNRWSTRLGRTERRFDFANPRLDMRLPGGFRLHAIMAVTERPTITIRCPYSRKVTLQDLIKLRTIDAPMASFLRAAVKGRLNIIVAGGTGTGKTTLLKSLLYEVPPSERIITLEDTLELGLSRFPQEHPNVVEMETRQENVEGEGEINLMDLTRECLRMSPDRVVIGEVRGAEALYMLKAMSQGNDGSMCTIHSESAVGVIDRVRGYVAEGVTGLPPNIVDGFFRNAVDLIVHVTRRPDRRRVISTIVEVQRDSVDGVRFNHLFTSDTDDIAQFTVSPSPRLVQRLDGWQSWR
ncbi:MAG: ATPase, T2SS/T4P/T4SS family [Actinomycetota bacterium]